MPEALAALVVYDPEASAEQNAAEMNAAIESVATGEVTQAVRDSVTESGPVRAGDWIGIVRGDGIVAVAGSAAEASFELLDQLLTPDRELLTVITGSDADPATTAAIEGWIADNRADLEVEIHAGGQPLYPYLFGAE
jgi:dihydroxyacetone kinase-like predicted kinase